MKPNILSHSPIFARGVFAGLLAVATSVSALEAAPATPAASDAKKPGANAANAAAPAVPVVGVVTLNSQSVPVVKRLPGRVKPVRVAQVRARVAGILLKQVFREGADVKEGDVLFEIEPNIYQARVDSAKASVAAAKAGVAMANAELVRASLQAKRYRELKNTKAISAQDIDNADATKLLAQANVESAAAALLGATAALNTAEIDLSYTKVLAPISGRIGRSLVTEGALVGQGAVTQLAEINQLNPVYVDFSIPANELSVLKQQIGVSTDWTKNFKVTLQLDGGKDYSVPGKLLLSEISVEPGTASVKVRSEFANPDLLLWPEMYSWGTFAYDDGKKAFLVPHQAVIRSATQGASVYFVGAGNKLVSVPIATIETSGTNWVIRGNDKFFDGAKLVVEGAERAMVPLRVGAEVRTVAAGAAAPATLAAPAAPIAKAAAPVAAK